MKPPEKPGATTPDGRQVDTCYMPAQLDPDQSNVVRLLHRINCARGAEPGHECAGRLIVDRNGMTKSCPLCGDQRSVHPPR